MSEINQDTVSTTATTYHPPETLPEEMLPIDKIRMDGNTQTRVGINQQVVSRYAAEMKREGASPFPPIDVFRDPDGCHWPGDGLHRLAAAKCCGQSEIMARVYPGTRLDALVHSANSNQRHGLPRTNADKRNCVAKLLAESAFQGEGNRQIARWCGVGDQLVAQVRRRLEKKNQVRDSRTSVSPRTRRGKDGKNYPAERKHRVKTEAPPLLSLPAPKVAEGGQTAVSAGTNRHQEVADVKGPAEVEGFGPEAITAEEEQVEPSGLKPAADPVQAGTPTPAPMVEPPRDSPIVQNILLPTETTVSGSGAPAVPTASAAGQPVLDESIVALGRIEKRLANEADEEPSSLEGEHPSTIEKRQGYRLRNGAVLPFGQWDDGLITRLWIQRQLDRIRGYYEQVNVEPRVSQAAILEQQKCVIEVARAVNRLHAALEGTGGTALESCAEATSQIGAYLLQLHQQWKMHHDLEKR